MRHFATSSRRGLRRGKRGGSGQRQFHRQGQTVALRHCSNGNGLRLDGFTVVGCSASLRGARRECATNGRDAECRETADDSRCNTPAMSRFHKGIARTTFHRRTPRPVATERVRPCHSCSVAMRLSIKTASPKGRLRPVTFPRRPFEGGSLNTKSGRPEVRSQLPCT